MNSLRFIVAFLCLTAAVWAQASRVDPNPAATVAVLAGPGQTAPLLAIPNATISLCGYPAQGFPCTNLATTYTDNMAITACPNNAQVTVPGSASCSSVTDAQGNFGFWVTPGLYSYEETFNGTVYGPYPITVTGGGNDADHLQGTPLSPQIPVPGQVITDYSTGVYTPTYGCQGIAASAFGASPQNADNAPQLNLALNAALTTGAGVVCLTGGPSSTTGGTYLIGSTIDIPDKVRLLGASRGDAGGVGTTIKANASFAPNTPLLTYGNLITLIPHFGTRISDLSLDCSNVTGCIAMQDNYGEEQSGGDHLLMENTSVCLQVNGSDQPSTGRVQNEYGWHDIECFPNTAAIQNVAPVQCNNCEEGGGFSRISIVGQSGHAFNYGMQVSGNNFDVSGVHIEQATQAGVIVGPPGSVGGGNLNVNNVVLSTGASGVAVEVYNNQVNYPKGLRIKGAEQNLSGQVPFACGNIRDDYRGKCFTSPDYEIGTSVSGTSTIFDMGYGNPWTIANPITNYFPFISYTDGSSGVRALDLKNSVTALGNPFLAKQDGSLDIGDGGVEGGYFLNLHNPGQRVCIDASANNNCSGLNLQGPMTADFVDGAFGNFYWDPRAGNFNIPGNGSGYIGGLVTSDPAGPLNIANGSGGVGIISKNGLSTPTTMTAAQMAAAVQVVIPGDGGLQISQPNIPGTTLPTCDANHPGRLFNLRGAPGVADHFEICEKDASNAYNWVLGPGSSDLVSVRTFGATGNGTSDDTSAFQNALNTILTPGRALYIPCGTYKLTGNINASLPSGAGLTIAGAGIDCAALNFVNGNGIVLTIADEFSSFHLKDFSIVTGAQNTGTGFAVTQTAGNPTPGGLGSSSELFRIGIRGTDQNHFYAHAFNEVGVANINFDSVTLMGGVDLSGHGQGDGMVFSGQVISAVNFVSGPFNVSKCNFNYLGQSIVYGALTQGLTVDQSNFTGDVLGVLVPPSLSVIQAPDQLTIANSQFFDFTAAVAVNSQTNSVNITNNLFGMPAGSNGVVSELLNFTIAGNTFVAAGASTGGIVLQSASYGTVTGNTFAGLGIGLSMDAATIGVNATPNTFHGNTTDVSDAGTNPITLSPLLKSITGTRFLCVGLTGTVTASVTACSGT